MVTAPILVFPDWNKEFNVHVDALNIALGEVLSHPGAGDIDHPIAFASRNISTAERTILQLKEKAWLWYMHNRNLDTICWEDILICSLITLH
jgi:hypothetical protein